MILLYLFPLVESIIEIRKNKFLKTNHVLASVNLGVSSFLIVTSFWLGKDSRAFFLLVESIIEIRRNPYFEENFC